MPPEEEPNLDLMRKKEVRNWLARKKAEEKKMPQAKKKRFDDLYEITVKDNDGNAADALIEVKKDGSFAAYEKVTPGPDALQVIRDLVAKLTAEEPIDVEEEHA